MISTNKFISILEKKKINFFCGVPDSVLSSFVNGIFKKRKINITAPNEGSAISAGIGYYLKTKKLPLISFKIQELAMQQTLLPPWLLKTHTRFQLFYLMAGEGLLILEMSLRIK